MGTEKKLNFSPNFLAIKWDNKAKVGTITTLNDEKIHFFADDLKTMLETIEKIMKETHGNVKT